MESAFIKRNDIEIRENKERINNDDYNVFEIQKSIQKKLNNVILRGDIDKQLQYYTIQEILQVTLKICNETDNKSMHDQNIRLCEYIC